MANPSIHFWQLDNAIDPSGTRDLGLAGSGFVKRLDTSSSGHLDFGAIDITTSGEYAGTKLIFFRVNDMGDADQVSNFRFYISSLSAWGAGSYLFKMRAQQSFESGVVLGNADNNVPTSLPAAQNIQSTHDDTFIQAVAESGCSEYIYLDVYADTDVTVGTYGGPGNNGFRYRLTYDFS